jgi:signal transduction histidine kinase
MVPAVLGAGFAAGMLLHLVLLILVAARPSPRRLDRVFFFLFAALFAWHTGNLLQLSIASFEGAHRLVLLRFARMLAFSGLAALPALLVDVHAEYARLARRRALWLFYVPLALGGWGIWSAAKKIAIPTGPWTAGFIVYFAAALAVAGLINLRLARRAAGHLRAFYWTLAIVFWALALACVYAFLVAPAAPALQAAQSLLMLSSIIPSALVGYWMFRFNFLEAAAQRTVGLAVLGLLGLLAYALVIERLARRLEQAGFVPSAVTEAVLVFFLVVLVEPVWRRIRRWMAERVSMELLRLEAINAELQARALAALPEDVRALAQQRISEFLGFPVVVGLQGELQPGAGRELKFREVGTLRVLEANTAEALARARLLAERLRIEHELAEREKMAALGEMTAFIAHRLKNPLSAINTLVQLISERSPEAAEACQVIRGEVRRLSHAVSDLLRFTRPDEPQWHRPSACAPDEQTEVSVTEALEEAVRLFAAEAAGKQVTLEWRAESGLLLPVRRDWLHDILTSLLGNALDAAPAGSRVLVSCQRDTASNGSQIILAVEDAGPGVSPEHLEKIFDPFFTLKPGGTGLGLALARRRARQAGGDIRCISPVREGRGACFEVRFRGAEAADFADSAD